jgi:hypothetical protein
MSEYWSPDGDGLPEHLSTHEVGRIIKTYPISPEREIPLPKLQVPSPLPTGGVEKDSDMNPWIAVGLIILVGWGLVELYNWAFRQR